MTDDERNDLLELKATVERHLSTLHDEIINISPYKDDLYFDAFLEKAKYYRGILARINQQLADENE